ncbi:MAG: hypothetical protein ABI688_07680, partial [Bacteroidota bacterium]
GNKPSRAMLLKAAAEWLPSLSRPFKYKVFRNIVTAVNSYYPLMTKIQIATVNSGIGELTDWHSGRPLKRLFLNYLLIYAWLTRQFYRWHTI